MNESSIKRVHFIVPVHNEETILVNSLETLRAFCEQQAFPFAWRIHVVVNGSTDRTLERARIFQERFPERFLVTDFPEPGRGAALKRAWLASDAEVVAYMDVDLAVSLTHLVELVQPILAGKCEVSIGSRNLTDSQTKRSLLREIVSQSYNRLSRLILRHRFSDLQCGFKAVRLDAFRQIADHLGGAHWFFDTELVLWANQYGFRVTEVPVDWAENRFAARKSKVRLLRDSWQFLVNLIRLRSRMTKAGRR